MILLKSESDNYSTQTNYDAEGNRTSVTDTNSLIDIWQNRKSAKDKNPIWSDKKNAPHCWRAFFDLVIQSMSSHSVSD